MQVPAGAAQAPTGAVQAPTWIVQVLTHANMSLKAPAGLMQVPTGPYMVYGTIDIDLTNFHVHCRAHGNLI